jgi:hypothetical protein
MIVKANTTEHQPNTRKALKVFIDKALRLIIALAFTVLKSMDIWADLQTS